MSLLPAEASYVEEVTDYFLQFARGGLQISGIDADLVMAWEARGIPIKAVCRGIMAASDRRRRNARPGDERLRSIRSCESEVEKEWAKCRELGVGGHARKVVSDDDPR